MMQLYVINVSHCIKKGQPAPPGCKADIPFRVARTKSRNLPVYLDYKNGRTRVLTLIRKIDGNVVVSHVASYPVFTLELRARQGVWCTLVDTMLGKQFLDWSV